MRPHRVGILLASPVIAEGISSILSSVPGITLSRGPWTAGKDSPSVVVTDVFSLSKCQSAPSKVCVADGGMPQSVMAMFDEVVSIFDPPQEICRKIRSHLAPQESEQRGQDLSPREKDVIKLIVKGLANKEIAVMMNVSVNTVMTHRRNIAAKLKIHSPAGLTIFALATGLAKIEELT